MKRSLKMTAVALFIAVTAIQTAAGQLPGSEKNQISKAVKPLELNNRDSSTGFGRKSTLDMPVTLENGLTSQIGNQTGSKQDNSFIFLPTVTSRIDFSKVSNTRNPQRQSGSTFADKAYRVFGECANLALRNKYPSLSAPKGAETNITVSRR